MADKKRALYAREGNPRKGRLVRKKSRDGKNGQKTAELCGRP